ncbi:MAG TPA: DUF58 domain-containing protein [Firmicutes bacterium]|nr:DUF58 domain-containing protein [Bacillota bacterium]
MDANNKLLLAALLFLFPAALLAAGRFPYMFLYLLVLAPAIPYFRLRRSLARLKGAVTVSARTREVGQSFAVTYKIINADNSAFPYIELAGSGEGFRQEKQYLSLEPGEVKEVVREIFCRRRGIYSLDDLTVKTGDPFGFFQLEKPLASGGEVKVYPRIRHFPEIPLPAYQQMGDRTVPNAAFENYNLLAGLREWQDGDTVKRIHWKQSARQEQLIVKNYEKTAEAELTLFIDMYADSYRHDRNHCLEDLAVELAASLAYARLRDNLPLLVFSAAGISPPVRGRRFRDYEAIADHLIALAPVRTGSFFAGLRTQSYYLMPNTTLYLLTPSVGLKDADILLYLKRKGFSPVLFYLSLSGLSEDLGQIFGRLREAGIKVHVMQAQEGNGDR